MFKFDNLIEISEDIEDISVSKVLNCDIDECHKVIARSSNNLKILTQNIRSIYRNMPEFEILIERLKFDLEVIVLTECWIGSSPCIPGLNGYNSFHTRYCNKQNDGVVLYVKKNLSFSVEEPSFQEGNCLIAIQDNNIAIICIYRSPSYHNIDTFLTSLNTVLQKLDTIRNIFLIGDINIDIKKASLNSDRYLTVAAFHGLFPSHTLTTREDSDSCLDHILIKTNFSSITMIPQVRITDHNPVLISVNLNLDRFYVTTSYKKLNIQNIKTNLLKINLTPVFAAKDPNYAIEYLTNSITNIISNNTSIITLSSRKKILKPWITPGLLRCIKNRDKLHKKSKLFPNNLILKHAYTRYRNFCNALLRKIKNSYEINEVNNAKNDTKKLWKILKSKINTSNKTTNTLNDLLNISSSPMNSLNSVNKYFIDVGKNLAEKFPIDKHSYHSSSSDINRNTPAGSFVLLDTTEEEVNQLINGLKNSSAVGWDLISNRFLKDHKCFLAPPLTHIFNLCLKTGIFPTILKKSEIHPIYKSGDKKLPSNYRPISILPSISKILEKIINNRLIHYLETNNLLATNQFGFRRGKSTDDAVFTLTEFVSQNLDKGKKVISIFLDLAKAFDTISIPKLIYKLENLGIRGTQLKLFKSYLSERLQCIRIGDYVSNSLPINFGVPQGSILGPTLFLIYINNLSALVFPQGKLISFADDTALIFVENTWSKVFAAAQNGFDMANEWLRSNTLTINTEKTKYILHSIRKISIPTEEYQLISHSCRQRSNCSCQSIERVDSIKYLGVFIDSHLNFKQHIYSLSNRIRKLTNIFRNLRNIVEPLILKRIYFALCQSLISYCISSWGGASKTTLKPLEIAQRAVLKVCTFRPLLSPTHELYKYCEVLTVRQLFLLSIILKQHAELNYTPKLLNKRRNQAVCVDSGAFRTMFIHKFYSYLGPFIYNAINKKLNILSANRKICKLKIVDYFLNLSYEDTEKLTSVCN